MFANLMKQLFGGDEALREVLSQNPTFVDVRSAGEFSTGSVPGAINVPLDRIQSSVGKLKKKKRPLILFCASGMRSSSAVSILRSQGIENVHNGGSVGKVMRLVNQDEAA